MNFPWDTNNAISTPTSTLDVSQPQVGVLDVAKEIPKGITQLSGAIVKTAKNVVAQGVANVLSPTPLSGRSDKETSLTLEDKKKALAYGPIGSFGYETTLQNISIMKKPSQYSDALIINSVPGLFSKLAKSVDVNEITGLLKKVGVTEDLSSVYAPILAKTSKEADVANIVSHITEMQKITKPVTNVSEKLAETLKPGELPQPPYTLPQKSGVANQLNEGLSYNSKLPTIDPETQIINALNQSKKVVSLQDELYTAERAKRFAKAETAGQQISGEQGFYEELSKLKGSLPKVQFEAMRERLGQDTIDSLFKKITNSPQLTYIETIPARRALLDLINEGKVPTRSQQDLLGKVFSPEFMQAVTHETPSLFAKFKEAGLQLANMPRTLMSSFLDFSFPMRQGVFAAPTFRKQFFNSFKDQFSWFASEDSYKAVMEEITQRPNFNLMRGRVAFTDLGSKMTGREEKYMGNWAEKIPVLGRGVKATERAYTGFANKFRADIFDDLAGKAKDLGYNLNDEKNVKLVKEIANFVNNSTGRGNLPDSFKGSAAILNAFFFSPRLAFSRLNLLNPVYYIKAEPFVRKQALKTLFTFAGTALTILGATKIASTKTDNINVEADPRSSDFLKIKVGNTRVDILGGFQQYVKLAAQLISGQFKSSTGTGIVTRLGEKLPNYNAPTRWDMVTRMVESKEAPIFSFITAMMKGSDMTGQPLNVKNEVLNRITPMIISDVIDLVKDNPKLLPLSILGVFGEGLQTYAPVVKVHGQVQPWSESTAKLQYNQDTLNEANRYKQRIKQAAIAGDKDKAIKLQQEFDNFSKQRQNELNSKKKGDENAPKKDPFSFNPFSVPTASATGLSPDSQSSGNGKDTGILDTTNRFSTDTIFATPNTEKLPDLNSNPGNIEFIPNDWQEAYGAQRGEGNRFAIFPTAELGIDAMKRLLTSKTYKNLSVDKAMFRWTGSGLEGKGYNAKDVGLSKNIKISQLSKVQINKLLVEMARREGFSQLDKMKEYLNTK